jgi:CRISPR-associated exonuclease Cas4
MDDYIAIAALNQFSYCSHRCWRMFCAQEFQDNQYTVDGTLLHERVHTVGEGNREETLQVRAIWLKSERYRLIGKSDLIEENDGQWYPSKALDGDRFFWGSRKVAMVCYGWVLGFLMVCSFVNGF